MWSWPRPTDLTDPATVFDFVVLDDVTPTVWPAGNVLAIHVVNTNWLQGVTLVEGPPIVDWRSAHPLLRYSAFRQRASHAKSHGESADLAVSLADSPQAPLMLAGELGRQRIIWIGFDILESNWPLPRVISDLHRQCGGVAQSSQRQRGSITGQSRRRFSPGIDAPGKRALSSPFPAARPKP